VSLDSTSPVARLDPSTSGARSEVPGPTVAGGKAPRPGLPTRFLGFVRRHPVLLLFLLTPGIPEYLSGSSQLSGVVLAPGLFLILLAGNAGLYTAGVLLIREAVLRWKKGWLSVLVLGLAYGILEEGLALSTLFNPHASVVGVLGNFGHWMGVSWVWASGVLLIHVVFSVAVPILLLGLALPETRGRPLVGRRGLTVAVGVLGADVLALLAFTVFGVHFWMGWPLLLSSAAVIAALVVVARQLPNDWLRPSRPRPLPTPRIAAVVGVALFPAALLTQALSGWLGLPAAGVVAAMLGVEAAFFLWAWTRLRSPGSERTLLGFALGLLAPLAVLGFLIGFPVEVELVGTGLMIAFFLKLFRKYPDRRAAPTILAAHPLRSGS
jgi:hypothetical protein